MALFTGKRRMVLTLVALTVAALAFLGYLFDGAGVKLPFTGGGEYKIGFSTDDVDNLVPISDVSIAGVHIGKVEDVTTSGGHTKIELSLDPGTTLHQGTTVRVGAKSLEGESYVDIVDGTGPALDSGSELPPEAVKPSVQLSDVLASLDPKTRDDLGALVRSAGAGTAGTQADISKVMGGLGDIGRQGYTAVDALANQSNDLTALANEASKILAALNTGEGQIGTMVQNAQKLTAATNGQSQALSDSMRQLPGVLASARTATGKLTDLSGALAPVAADLSRAAPDLNVALQQLPGATQDLRGLLPNLNGTLTEAPSTLDRVPGLSQDAQTLIPQAQTLLSNLNPMLSYLKPYGADVAAFFSNFGAMLKYTDEAGIHYYRLQPIEGTEQVVKGVPLKLPTVLSYKNPYPDPGQAGYPGGRDFTRLYPQGK